MTTDPRKGRRVAHVAKLVAFSLLPALVLAILAETYATLALKRRVFTSVEPGTNKRVYHFRMGVLPWSRRADTPLNSLGLPDEEFPSPGAIKTCTHIVFAGDSYTFG